MQGEKRDVSLPSPHKSGEIFFPQESLTSLENFLENSTSLLILFWGQQDEIPLK